MAAAVVLYVQQLGWAAQRNLDEAEDWELIQQSLEDAGMDEDGVFNQIRCRLDHVSAL